MKITHLVGSIAIIAGLAVVSAKAACDGPKLVTGSVGSCSGCVWNATDHCPGTVTRYNDRYTCGGWGYESCSTRTDTIGYSGVPCEETGVDYNNDGISDFASCQFTLWAAYNDCLIDANKGNVPYSSCHNPNDPNQYCLCVTCVAGTSGGTAITGAVYSGTGQFTDCMMAKRQESPSPVRLALVTLRGLGH